MEDSTPPLCARLQLGIRFPGRERRFWQRRTQFRHHQQSNARTPKHGPRI